MPDRVPNRHRHILVNEGVTMGSCSRALAEQDKEFARWLCAQTPKGATLIDTLFAVAVDTFHEEVQPHTTT